MSASSSDSQDPYAPRKIREQEQPRPVPERPSSRPSRVEASDLDESEAQIPWRRSRPAVVTLPPLVGPAPVPPRPEPRRSIMGQFATFGGASIVTGLSVVAYYHYSNNAPPSPAPHLASNSSRPVQTVTVTPPAPPAASDERSATAPPVATATAGPVAVPALPAAPSRTASVNVAT